LESKAVRRSDGRRSGILIEPPVALLELSATGRTTEVVHLAVDAAYSDASA